MRRLRRTKILATLGPSSSDRNVIAELFRAGAYLQSSRRQPKEKGTIEDIR